MQKVIYILIAIGLLAGVLSLVLNNKGADDEVACTAEAMLCPDGSSVGREGPNCEFAPCPLIDSEIEAKSDLIVVESVAPKSVITPGLIINGKARGQWFFEASFPIVITNWDGLIIGEVIATADGEWMTENFVPFTATLNFVNPYKTGDPDFMKNGSLILRKDNPSGLPEHDDALEIPIRFAP